MNTKSASSIVDSIGTIVTATIFFLFPLFFLTITTDFFTFPKQLLVVFGSLLLLVLWGVKVVIEKRITLVTNPLNIPILIFAVILILSTFFSASLQDAVLQTTPVVLLCVFFFTTVNFIQEKSSYAIVLTSLIIGSALSAILSILAYFNIFLLPFEAVKSQAFNTHGSPIQYGAFLLPILALCLTSLIAIAKKGKLKSLTRDYSKLMQLGASVIFGIALGLVVFQVISSPQKPILLPFNHGFQIAFAAISQDSQRLAQSLLVGSGYGTFSTDFTRYVTPSFNGYTFWNLTFAFSSSYILELLATTGVLGLFAFAFIFVNLLRSKSKISNPVFLSTLVVFGLSLVIPFSYSIVFLLFALLSLFVAHRSIENAKGFDTISLNLVALKQGLIALSEEQQHHKKKENLILPIIVLALTLLASVFVLFYLTGSGATPRNGYIALVNSDILFAKSFSQQALRSGTQTYNLETQAINEYPYRSDYYRLFSQINLALAANIVNAQQGKKPSEEVQNNIIALLQQSINSARQAVTLSPYVSLDWQNLGQIYRNLIGVGQNAEQFAVASYNQAITLNPSNPGLRIELGGVYYQLKQWDLAQNQFTIAAQLKNDYANAYYNLGHVLEEKGDLQNALTQYQTVQQLVANDKGNLDKISSEIKAVQEKIGKAQENIQTKQPTEDKTPLGVVKPQADFPPKDPRVKIPEPPKGQPNPTPTTTVTPSPSAEPTQGQ